MIFFGLAIFLPTLWLLPWWALPLLSFVLGLFLTKTWSLQWQMALMASMGAMILSFLRDGQSYGLISKHLAPLFGLPHPALIFALMGVLSFILSLFWLRTGALLRRALS